MFANAFAKINLRLRVTGVRDDGYHELEMVNTLVSLADEIEITLTHPTEPGKVTIECLGEILHADCLSELNSSEQNIAALAASKYLKKVNSALGVHIRIKKQIPLGSGLGGGSSNAAAVLRLLSENYALLQPQLPNLNPSQLMALGLSLGADVPYCMVGGLSIVTGIGEVITPLSLELSNALPGVLVFPGIHSSTREIFAAWKLSGARTSAHVPAEPKNYEELLSFVENDLLLPFQSLHPEVDRILTKLALITGVVVGLSGSGSTFFVIPREASESKVTLIERLHFAGIQNEPGITLHPIELFM